MNTTARHVIFGTSAIGLCQPLIFDPRGFLVQLAGTDGLAVSDCHVVRLRAAEARMGGSHGVRSARWSEARQMLGTTRRVAVPLLEIPEPARETRQLTDGRRDLGSQRWVSAGVT